MATTHFDSVLSGTIRDAAIVMLNKADFATMINLSQTCQQLYQYVKNEEMKKRANDILKMYIYRRVNYWSYVKEGGWKDISKFTLKIGGLAYSIFSIGKAIKETSLISLDTPKIPCTYTVPGEIEDYEVTTMKYDPSYPHVQEATNWAGTAAITSTITGIGSLVDYGISQKMVSDLLQDTHQQIIKHTSSWVKVISPLYFSWMLKKIQENLQEPNNWKQDPILSRYQCRLSGRLTIFPVTDKCGHLFDYRFIMGHLQNSQSCPINQGPLKRRLKAEDLAFNRTVFLAVISRLKVLRGY